jgi:hypothetical protein
MIFAQNHSLKRPWSKIGRYDVNHGHPAKISCYAATRFSSASSVTRTGCASEGMVRGFCVSMCPLNATNAMAIPEIKATARTRIPHFTMPS